MYVLDNTLLVALNNMSQTQVKPTTTTKNSVIIYSTIVPHQQMWVYIIMQATRY